MCACIEVGVSGKSGGGYDLNTLYSYLKLPINKIKIRYIQLPNNISLLKEQRGLIVFTLDSELCRMKKLMYFYFTVSPVCVKVIEIGV